MKRKAIEALNQWRLKTQHKPLLLRGARQVGKTHLVREFAKIHFENLVEINFELEPQYLSCFDTQQPEQIIERIEAIGRHKIQAGKTLLFLDEIQECPAAIAALRYFYELKADLHVIGAGSLLEFALRDAKFSMPVGRVSFMYLKPMSFEEFLIALGYEDLYRHISKATPETPLAESLHKKALELVQLYTLIGGMPDVLKTYIETQNTSEAMIVQNEILSTYRRDFGKYANIAQHKYLQNVFTEAPKHLGEQIKYSKINPEFRARDLSQAMLDLQDAGLISRVYATTAAGFPLAATINDKKFKLLFLDVGLAQNSSGLTPELAMNKDISLLTQGNIAEQFVGQELLASQDNRIEPELLYWARDGRGNAEVDYVLTYQNHILPIEVKSGTSKHFKSLRVFLKEKTPPIGVVISSAPLSRSGEVLYLPLYMSDQFDRIVGQCVE